ncbi:MAG: DUF305 domain-containing protein [Candidatus Saccharimonadales bacterium]
MKKRVAVATVAVIGIVAAGWYLLKVQPAATPPQTTATEQQTVRLDPNEHDFFDVDFAQKLIVHHQQGIEITDALLGHSSNQRLRDIASGMRQSQVDAEAQYKTWLEEWNEEYTNLSDFPQMDGHDMYPSYPGLVSAADLSSIKNKRGDELDQMFVVLMTEHHEEALTMRDMGNWLQYGKLIDFKDKVFSEYETELQEMEKG